jgi:hypothetical protein
MSAAEDAEDDFFTALGAGDPLACKLFNEMAEKLMRPVHVLSHGYLIPDTRPGGTNAWRPLGLKERPLARLAAFEVSADE